MNATQALIEAIQHMTPSNYSVCVGDNNTDLGRIGLVKTLLGAKRKGRAAVRDMLPNGEGTYTIHDQRGNEVMRGERSIRTGHEWLER